MVHELTRSMSTSTPIRPKHDGLLIRESAWNETCIIKAVLSFKWNVKFLCGQYKCNFYREKFKMTIWFRRGLVWVVHKVCNIKAFLSAGITLLMHIIVYLVVFRSTSDVTCSTCRPSLLHLLSRDQPLKFHVTSANEICLYICGFTPNKRNQFRDFFLLNTWIENVLKLEWSDWRTCSREKGLECTINC